MRGRSHARRSVNARGRDRECLHEYIDTFEHRATLEELRSIANAQPKDIESSCITSSHMGPSAADAKPCSIKEDASPVCLHDSSCDHKGTAEERELCRR